MRRKEALCTNIFSPTLAMQVQALWVRALKLSSPSIMDRHGELARFHCIPFGDHAAAVAAGLATTAIPLGGIKMQDTSKYTLATGTNLKRGVSSVSVDKGSLTLTHTHIQTNTQDSYIPFLLEKRSRSFFFGQHTLTAHTCTHGSMHAHSCHARQLR